MQEEYYFVNVDTLFLLPISCCRPFSVSPENGSLAVNDSLQVELTFQPMTVGDHNDNLVINFDSGILTWSHSSLNLPKGIL